MQFFTTAFDGDGNLAVEDTWDTYVYDPKAAELEIKEREMLEAVGEAEQGLHVVAEVHSSQRVPEHCGRHVLTRVGAVLQETVESAEAAEREAVTHDIVPSEPPRCLLATVRFHTPAVRHMHATQAEAAAEERRLAEEEAFWLVCSLLHATHRAARHSSGVKAAVR